ncbi:hypothetical protein BDY24DRAFT_394395 [Mrakia frigida]|uniref:uncharacterized protein n=1 Tax=Mrakia frigida TaxID=29902 RepID=UPI003FCC0E80
MSREYKVNRPNLEAEMKMVVEDEGGEAASICSDQKIGPTPTDSQTARGNICSDLDFSTHTIGSSCLNLVLQR